MATVPAAALTYSKVWPNSTSADTVQIGLTNLFNCFLGNSDTVGCVVKLYDKATPPVLASDTPKLTFNNPASGGNNVEVNGVSFTSGLFVDVTVNAAANDTVAVTAGKVMVNLVFI